MRARYTLFQRCLIGQPTHHGSSLTTGIRHKSTLKDILRPESFASIVQKDFEQFHEAKVAFDAKLRTYFQQAKELSQNYHYDAAIKELQKIIALTRKMDSDDLSHNQVLMLADTYAALASILRVGSSEEGILALRCCDNAIELNPAHAEAIAMRRSLLSEHAVFPTDSYTDFMEEQQDNKTHNLT